MKIKRIDIFRSDHPYGLLNYFAEHLHLAFQSIGVESHLIEFNANIFSQLNSDPPDYTLAFNRVEPPQAIQLLCNVLKLPHVLYLPCLPFSSVYLLQSPYAYLTCIDESGAQFLKASKNAKTEFMSLGVQKSLCVEPFISRPYDLLFPATCVDYQGIELYWQSKYSKDLCEVLHEAADNIINDKAGGLDEAFIRALYNHPHRQSRITPEAISGAELFESLNLYIVGKTRMDLIRSIKNVQIDIFGGKIGAKGWKEYVGDQSNVIIHEPIPFEEVVKVMQQSKMVLNHSPCIKRGGDIRIWTGIACGALVLTDENEYLSKEFTNQESLVFYRGNKLNSLEKMIDKYLANAHERVSVVKEGQKIVQSRHTWVCRARALIEWLECN